MTADSSTTSDPAVVAAIMGQRLAQWADDTDTGVAATAAATCVTIGELVAEEARDVADWLKERGHEVRVDTTASPRQRHDIAMWVDSFDAADAVAGCLADAGFERWDQWTGAAARSFRAHAGEITVARTNGHSYVLRLRWSPTPGGGAIRRFVRSVFRPTSGDWSMVSLPEQLWPAYSIVRPIRLALERTGRRDPHAAGLGPFLSTPRSLIPALLDIADLRPDDTLLDVGCGDGRLVIEAAESVGCRAVGVDHLSDLVDRARAAATASGVDGRVTFVHGDVREADLSTITAAFMFLPMNVAAELVADTLHRLPTGARLVIHEQTPLPAEMSPPPESSHAVIAPDAVTVAHRWTT